MFERNQIDNNEQAEKRQIPVRIVLDDGEALRGRLLVAPTRSLSDELGAASGFVQFAPYGGDPTHLAKSAIRLISETNVPRANNLERRLRQADQFDPHQILDIPRGAEPGMIRAAYLGLAKIYHPDRFSSLDLPDEMLEYASSMARRINSAYAALQNDGAGQAAPGQGESRNKPIFEKRASAVPGSA